MEGYSKWKAIPSGCLFRWLFRGVRLFDGVEGCNATSSSPTAGGIWWLQYLRPTNKGALRLSRCIECFGRSLDLLSVAPLCKNHQEYQGGPQEYQEHQEHQEHPRTPKSSPGAPRSSPRSDQKHPKSTQERAPRSTRTCLSETGSDFRLGQICDPFYV